MSYEYSLVMEDVLGSALAFNGISFLSSGMIHIAVYIFTALSLYTIASRRGISKAWLAWIPVANVWIIGSLSDQYRYVVKGETKSKRKWLLTLAILQAVIYVVFVVLAVIIAGNAFFGMINHISEHQLMNRIMGPVFGLLGMCIPLVGVAIAQAILSYMALYDVYSSSDPKNSVIYLVLSIIPGVSTIAQPLFLFLCRDKDEGMPPRRQAETVYPQEEPVFASEDPPVWEEPKEEDPWQETETE